MRVRAPHECQRRVSIHHIRWGKSGRTGSILNMPLAVKSLFKGTAVETRGIENKAAQHQVKVLTFLVLVNGSRFLGEAISFSVLSYRDVVYRQVARFHSQPSRCDSGPSASGGIQHYLSYQRAGSLLVLQGGTTCFVFFSPRCFGPGGLHQIWEDLHEVGAHHKPGITPTFKSNVARCIWFSLFPVVLVFHSIFLLILIMSSFHFTF